MSYGIWLILMLAGVSDAQRHRIPNPLVLALLLVVTVELFQQQEVMWWLHLKGFLATFAIGFVLYLIRAMAGGDVKLLAVIGLWLGADVMWQVTPYIIIAGGVIGAFYLALHLASSTEPINQQVKAYAVQRVTPGWRSQQPLVIPFAPAIVVGLAYYFYVH
ncbi:A24 family peptidase [Vibrio alfacsensis]|uniref:A24 family peptidase n=1 Tax=Vibrio alfacsensis TaxID=1074311 RepID=UPI00406788AD